MRSILVLFLLSFYSVISGQGSGFSFSYTGPTQILVGSDCLAELDWGHPNTPTASSNLPGGFIVSFNIYSISGGYEIGNDVPGGTVVTVFYQAIDNFGNSALFGFTITFTDNIPPTFDPLSLPPNLTVNCIGNFPVANVEVHDNCEDYDIVLTVNFTETNNAALCTGGVITRKWVADDDLGNFATFTQTITVLPDNTPPVIANNLVNGTAPCTNAMAQYSAWLTAQRAAFSASDNGCGIMTLSDNAPSPSIITSFCGEIVVTFTAKDNCNNISTVQRTFTVTNNIPPVIDLPANNSGGNCSQSNINQLFNSWLASHGGATAADDCSSVLWTTFPPSPTLGDTCNSVIPVLFIAGDGCGNFDTTAANFTLTDVTPPVISTDPASIVLSCSAATVDSLLMDWIVTSGHAVAHDLCTTDPNLVRGYKIGGVELTAEQLLQAWQDSLNGPCRDGVIINGIGINNVRAYLAVNFTYADACGNEAGKTGYFGITDNGRPQFVILPADTNFSCSQGGSWQTVFADWYNSAGGATFMDACSDVQVMANISVDSAMQLLSSSLDTSCMQGAEVTIQFSLMDACGNLSMNTPSASFSLQDTLAPVLTSPAADLMASCSLNGQTQLTNWLDTLGGAVATDGCAAVNWSFSWIDSIGATLSGLPFTGPYPQIATLDCSGGLEVTFTAMDACQNSISDVAFFSLIDTLAPQITIEDVTISLACGTAIPNDTPSVTDACNGPILLTSVDVTGPDTCFGLPTVVVRTWSATDECGNISTAQITYFRIDTTPPAFQLPADSVDFCAVDTLMLLNLADNCDPAPVSSFEDQLTGVQCQQMLQRVWTVSDACGNSTTALQVFDLSDVSPPVIEVSPGDLTYTCGSGSAQESYEAWLASVVITDACSEVSYFIAMPGSYILGDTNTWPGTPLPDSVILVCSENLLISGDLVVYDVCGNVIVETISFAVNDTTPPVIVCPAVLQVEPDTSNCTGQVQLTIPFIEEACYPDSIAVQLSIDGGTSFSLDPTGTLDTVLQVGIHTAIWSATDCKGNRGTCQTVIEIIDENAISLTCPADTVLFAGEMSCSDSLWIHPPASSLGLCAQGVIGLRFEIIGNADPDSMAFTSSTDSVLVVFSQGQNEVLLIASDASGDIDTCRYFVEIRDTISPQLICQPDTVFLHPSGIGDADLSGTSLVLSATDNCSVELTTYDPSFVNCSNANQTIDVIITATDAAGNTDTCQSNVFVVTQPLMPLWSRGLCDDTLRLFANIPDGPGTTYTFNWSGPNGFISNVENPVIPDADTTFSGTYVLTVESASGCISTGFINVEIQTLVSPEITVSQDTVCVGELLTMTTQLITGNVIYQWFQVTPSGDTFFVESTDPLITFTLDSPGSFQFYAVVIQDTCVSTPGGIVNVESVTAPVAAIADINMPLCTYDTLFLSPIQIIDSLTYLWTGPLGFTSTDPTPAGIPANTLDSGDAFYLTVSNHYCSSIPDSLEILIQPIPSTPSITGEAIVCEDGTFTLSTNSAGDQFVWIDPSNNTFSTTIPELTITNAQQDVEGSWFVIASLNGCISDTSTAFNVQVDSAIAIDIIAPALVCENENVQLSSSPDVQGTYTWSGPGGFASMDQAPVIDPVEGTYILFVQTSTGCESSDTVFMEVDQLPVITSLFHDAVNCVDTTTDVRLWATTVPASIGNFEFQWIGPSGFASQDSSPVIQQFSSALNGTYYLIVTNGACVSDTAFIDIQVTDGPATPVISGATAYCFGDTILLNIDSPVAGGVYTWSFADTSVILNSPGHLIIPDASADLSGQFAVDVFVNGCISSSAAVNITVLGTLPPPVITTPALVCEGDSLLLTSDAPAGAFIEWFGPNGFNSTDPAPFIFPADPGHSGGYSAYYSVNGCPSDTSSFKMIVVQPAINSPQLLADVSAVCIDDPETVILCIDPSTLIEGAVYTWFLNGTVTIAGPDPDSCILINGDPLQAGPNSITAVAELNGCPSEAGAAVIIQGDAFPSISADAGIDMTYCPDEVILLDAAQPFPSTGEWSAIPLISFADVSDPETSVNGLPPGIYTLTWTLSYASCIDYSADSVLIIVIPSPEILPDTVEVLFGQTSEFIVTLNDTIDGNAFTLEVLEEPQKGNALHAGNGVFRYTPDVGFVGTDMMIYRICSADCPEECGDAVVILRVGNEDDCFTPTLFTPNEDGINDRLIVPCLETEQFPDNRIIIFNEWGDAVYEASPYQNDWDGTYDGESLPVGTYFYIMDFGDGSEVKRSFLVIER